MVRDVSVENVPRVILQGTNVITGDPVDLRADVSSTITIIPYEHSKVHQGEFFSVGHYQTGVANGASIDVLIQTHATYTAHMNIKVSAGADAEFRLYEGTTFSSAGTGLNVSNNNRASANVHKCTVTHTPTITAVGTLYDGIEFLPGGSGGVSVGALAGTGVEQIVMASNEAYLLRLTNVGGVASSLNIKTGFYEVASG